MEEYFWVSSPHFSSINRLSKRIDWNDKGESTIRRSGLTGYWLSEDRSASGIAADKQIHDSVNQINEVGNRKIR
jgi:hypothetical protein